MNSLYRLDINPVVTAYEVISYDQEEDVSFLKLRIKLIDGPLLHTPEKVSRSARKYAFHWQRPDNSYLVRWDNAPHYPDLASFPHHRQDNRSGTETITDSHEITLDEVTAFIQEQMTFPSL